MGLRPKSTSYLLLLSWGSSQISSDLMPRRTTAVTPFAPFLQASQLNGRRSFDDLEECGALYSKHSPPVVRTLLTHLWRSGYQISRGGAGPITRPIIRCTETPSKVDQCEAEVESGGSVLGETTMAARVAAVSIRAATIARGIPLLSAGRWEVESIYGIRPRPAWSSTTYRCLCGCVLCLRLLPSDLFPMNCFRGRDT
jgi:hypothetical protein